MDGNEVENKSSSKHSFDGFITAALFIWDFLKIVLIALAIIIPIRYFVFQPFIVSGSSMEPNFMNNQYLIIDELSMYFSDPKRGEVVVMRYPKDHKQYFIKRVVGLPLEKVEISDNGKVIIINEQNPNGFTLDEPYLPNQNLTNPHDKAVVGGNKTLTLGLNEYFMMGDNRVASSDSRDWGALKRSEMVGKVILRALPLNEFKLYNQTPAY